MGKKSIYLLIGIAMGTFSAAAQSGGEVAPPILPNGYLMSQASFGLGDMLRMSQYNTGFGTARSASMGGAFTSLGADLSSMNINPAGLGMYLSSEVSISPSLTIGQMSNKAPGSVYGTDNSRTRFAMNNVGIALNLYQGSGSLTSFTLGFGYNKLADFNLRSTTGLANSNLSIASVFTNQLRGIEQGAIGPDGEPWQYDPYDWGAILAYKSALIESVVDGDKNALYTIKGFSEDMMKTHLARTSSRGGIGEYSIAGGFNFGNKFYFGIAMGIQDIYMKQYVNYDEQYLGQNPSDDPLKYMLYDQQTKITGSAVNFKLGFVVRPVDGLRIGVAVHTPSIVSIEKDYSASMYTQFTKPDALGNPDYVERESGISAPKYDFATPTRLMAGISYTFGKVGILSADYERTWYNGMRLRDANESVNDDFKAAAKNDFKGSNTFRVGGELLVTPQLSLRAGYVNRGSLLQDETRVFDQPYAYKGYNISAGLGYRFSRNISLDMAYIYMNTTYTMYDLFAANGVDNANQPINFFVGGIDQHLTRHNITLSLNIRF